MTDRLRIATAQLNPTVGDIAGNFEAIAAAHARAAEGGADLCATPELSVLGYPPEDLILKRAAVADAKAACEGLAARTAGDAPALLVGCPWPDGDVVRNAAVILDDGAVAAVRFKRELPNYGVFDEHRVFAPGPMPEPVDWRGVRLGLPICEDVWLPEVPTVLAKAGADIQITINGSPWRRGIEGERRSAFLAWAREAHTPVIFVNQAGGQDELVFDGASWSWDAGGAEAQRLAAFAEDFDIAQWRREGGAWRCVSAKRDDMATGLGADWRAVTLSVRDYVTKNGFPGVVIGLSGGIDSALTAAIAVDALGADKVWCVRLPSVYTSRASMDDAAAIAELLGVRLNDVPIAPAVDAFDAMLQPLFANRAPDLTEENVQSRVRGATLMALSNKFGPMVLTTGNKSEMAVGYATLYGDMNGGYNPLKDLYKTDVFALSAWRNAHRPEGARGPDGPVMPQAVIDKPPSAELRPDQTDQDSLPPYDVLDDILRGLVDREEEVEEAIARGHDPAVVARVQHLLYVAEYKRRQAAPGPKIGPRNFGRDRRYPITNRYRDAVPDALAHKAAE